MPVFQRQDHRALTPDSGASIGTWLNNGTAILDDHGRVIQCNDEFASWAGSATLVFPYLPELLAARCPAWSGQIQQLLDLQEPFCEAFLEDTSAQPPQWYRLELAGRDTTRFARFCRCLPPLAHLTEGTVEQFIDEEQSRREIYARLLRAEGQLKMLSGRWPGVLFSQRPDFTFSFVSERIEDWTGIPVEEWRRTPERFWEVVHEADAAELQGEISRCKAGEPITATYRLRHVRTGRVTYILERREAIISGNSLVLGYDGAWVDVTRQTIAEKRLASAVWKETLGTLTMGLAHDFSNIMAGVYSLSETYQGLTESDHPFQEGFGLIKRNAQQATQLVQRILQLHQGKVGNRNYHNANDLVAETLDVVRKTIRRIMVHTEYSPEQLPLYIDPVEFRQVLVNLTLNAADAMPDGGDLYFSTSLHQQMPRHSYLQGTVPTFPAVCISVRDTGTGIAPEHLNQIFDPFFTTKPLNKGSGLGLYNARLFAEKHSGAITVDSTENVGTTFKVWLPIADFTESERVQAQAAQGRKTLLLLEASGKALEPTAQCLRECGFYVATASSERAAVELLHSPEYQFDAVMTILNGQTRLTPRIFNEISRLKLPIKTIVQIAGSNEDELDGALLERASLVIGSEVPPLEIASRLREVIFRRG
ncbi:MAG: ATP-binding protein [Verrucomicrobiota bacterium]